eukprot:gnl/TRDRNA2_/TRDRNA2_93711_c0_seq1.p1 gnl/TRDRNA2_/TRDRNA2_93711_c0~~gnl/TRDRNA2_/TRDRNA2_93711_c0_seq1.p1  ORF type:complete len:128 (-),score=11.88 gnl/TRDRNA2_/TRDRNA2_93711_c0_seq1:167-550(-)
MDVPVASRCLEEHQCRKWTATNAVKSSTTIGPTYKKASSGSMQKKVSVREEAVKQIADRLLCVFTARMSIAACKCHVVTRIMLCRSQSCDWQTDELAGCGLHFFNLFCERIGLRHVWSRQWPGTSLC